MPKGKNRQKGVRFICLFAPKCAKKCEFHFPRNGSGPFSKIAFSKKGIRRIFWLRTSGQFLVASAFLVAAARPSRRECRNALAGSSGDAASESLVACDLVALERCSDEKQLLVLDAM